MILTPTTNFSIFTLVAFQCVSGGISVKAKKRIDKFSIDQFETCYFFVFKKTIMDFRYGFT